MYCIFIIGRGGEVARMTANSASWCDIFDCLTDDWNQAKTGRQDLMNYFNDWEHWEIDFYHALSGYLMCGAGAANYSTSSIAVGGNFVFPHLASLKGSGAAANVTNALRNISVLGPSFESTSLRCGASLTMVTHPTTSMFHTCVRAGHNMKEELGRTFEYIQASRATVAVGGLALAGYKNSLGVTSRAKLVFMKSISENEQQKVSNLMEELFNVPHIDWGKRAKRPLYDCMLATNLMALDSMISKYGMGHVMANKLIKTAKKFDIEYVTLIGWGESIREDFHLQNLPNQFLTSFNTQPGKDAAHSSNSLPSFDIQRRLLTMSTEIDTLKCQVRECLDIQRNTSQKIISIENKLDTCINLLTSARRSSPPNSPTNTASLKRGFNSSPVPFAVSLTPSLLDDSNDNADEGFLLVQPSFKKVSINRSYDEDTAIVIIDDLQTAVGILLAKYVVGKVKGREHLLKIPHITDEARGKRRLIKVMKYLLSFANNDDTAIIEGEEPRRDSVEWTAWNNGLQQVKFTLLKNYQMNVYYAKIFTGA